MRFDAAREGGAGPLAPEGTEMRWHQRRGRHYINVTLLMGQRNYGAHTPIQMGVEGSRSLMTMPVFRNSLQSFLFGLFQFFWLACTKQIALLKFHNLIVPYLHLSQSLPSTWSSHGGVPSFFHVMHVELSQDLSYPQICSPQHTHTLNLSCSPFSLGALLP